MKKHLILIVIISFICSQTMLHAQISHLWSFAQASSGSDRINDIITDAEGNVTAIGTFATTATIGGTGGSLELVSNGATDAMLVQYAADGTLIFAIGFGGSMDDGGNDVVRDSLGNFYVTGAYHGTMDIDPGPDEWLLEAEGLTDIYLAKFSAAGELLWAHTYGNDFSDDGRNLALDAAGNVYLGGGFRNTISFDIDGDSIDLSSTSGTTDVFLARFDSDGNAQWAISFGGGGTDNLDGMEIRDDRVFLTGDFSSTIDLDASGASDSHSSAGLNDIFLTAYDIEGNFVWGEAFGGSSVDFSHDLAIGPEGQVYITGNFWNTINFSTTGGTSEVTAGVQSDMFLAAFTTDGEDLWAISAGGVDAEEGLAVGAGTNGPVITGTFGSTVDFDPGPDEWELSSAGYYEVYLAAYTTDGELISAGSLPSSYSAYGQAIVVAPNNDIVTGGRFSIEMDMDPEPGESPILGAGGFSAYVARYSTCVSYAFSEEANICAGETIDFHGSILDMAGLYTAEFTTAAGCDSTFTLNLIVQEVDTSILVDDLVLTAVSSPDYTYQWLDCLDGMSMIPGETSNVFTATETGSYAVEISVGDCSETSACFALEVVEPTEISDNPIDTEWIFIENNTWQITIDQEVTLQVFDIHGRLLSTAQIIPGSFVWSGNELANGIYVLSLSNGSERSTQLMTIR